MIPITLVLKQWSRIELDVGARAIDVAAEEAEPDSGQYSSDVSMRLMLGQGWVRGGGLGKHGQGIPTPPPATGQTSKEGLGYGVNKAP